TGRFCEAHFGVALAILHRGLRAFLVVHHEVHGDPCAIGPFGIGRIGAIAHEVARRLPAHCGLLTSSAPICRAMSATFSFSGSIEIVFTPARRQASAWPGASPQSTISRKAMSGNSARARSCSAPR